jgi:hypothetical protein
MVDYDRVTFGASTRTYVFELRAEKEEDKPSTNAASEAELMEQLPMSFGGSQGRARKVEKQRGTEGADAKESAAEARKKVGSAGLPACDVNITPS